MGAELIGRRPVLALLGGLAACGDPASRARKRIDTAWHRADLDRLLQRWLAHAPQPGGGFQTQFNRAWQPRPSGELELTAQARLVYTFAVGHELTRDARYLEAARRGADFLVDRFVDPVHGGFFHTVALDGSPRAGIKRAYGHAFGLLALGQVFRVGQDARHRDTALKAWDAVRSGFFDARGGLVNECGRDFKPMGGARTQNPVMHMFEALLALGEATGDRGVQAGARRLGDFVCYQLLQGQAEGGARIPEWYDEQWQPLPTKDAGGYIDLGHQFEWAHLLSTAAAVSPVYAQVAERVLAYALATGYDDSNGGCGKRAFPDEQPTDTTKGWWQQAECLHALLVTAHASGRNDLWRRYEQTVSLVREQLADEQAGWRAAEALPCRNDAACKDEQPDPYHMVSLHRAALQLAGAGAESA